MYAPMTESVYDATFQLILRHFLYAVEKKTIDHNLRETGGDHTQCNN